MQPQHIMNANRRVNMKSTYIMANTIINWLSIVFLLTLIKIGNAGFACLSNPCLFGVCIDGLNSTYSCYCIDGYTGIQCQTNWDECWSAPCHNGGTCIDAVAYYNCTCPEGFAGQNCEENVDECLSNPCQNGAICKDRNNGYTCTCLAGYLGTHCEIDVAVCETANGARCHNGGECIEGPGLKFTCDCPQGWKGHVCQEEVNECESSPCQNGGVCVDKVASYVCACPMGYTGNNCEEEILICADNPCQNNALCLMEEGVPTCYCVPDFHGEKCEFQYDECQLGPKCTNGGVCIDGIDTFTCSCPPLLTGLLCECLILDENKLDCNYLRPVQPVTPKPNVDIITKSSPPIKDIFQTTTITPETSDISDEFTDEDISSSEMESSEETTTDLIFDYDTTSTVKYPFFKPKQEFTTIKPYIIPQTTFTTTYSTEFTSYRTRYQTDTKWHQETISTTMEAPKMTPTKPIFQTHIESTMQSPPESTKQPTYRPILKPTFPPTIPPTLQTTADSTLQPTRYPSIGPTPQPAQTPTVQSTSLTLQPTLQPTSKPAWQLFPQTTSFTPSTEVTEISSSKHTTIPPTRRITTIIPEQELETETQPLPLQTFRPQTGSKTKTTIPPIYTTYKMPSFHEKPEVITTSEEYIDYDTETTTFTPLTPAVEITSTISPFFTEYPDIFTPTKVTPSSKGNISRFPTYPSTVYIQSPTTTILSPIDQEHDSSEISNIPNYTTMIPPKVQTPTWSPPPSFRPTPPPFTFLPDHTTKSLYTDDLITYATATTEAPTTHPSTITSLISSITPSISTTYNTSHDCTKSGCFNGGTCVMTSEDSRCVCRFDWQGPMCESPIVIKNAAFTGDSYISHRIHKDIPHHESLEVVLPMHVQLKVRTRATNGLIMLAAAQGTKGGHYMALFLQKGLLQFQFSCGLQTMLLSELETPVNSGNEINIRAELDFSRNFTHCNASLLVNETLAMSGDQPTWLKLIPARMYTVDIIQNTWLHLGGAPQAPIGLIIELPPAQSGTGFTGCLHSLRINDDEREIFGDAFDGFGITECGSLACLSSPCRNGAACIKVDSKNNLSKEKWQCKCPTGYMGPTCEISICEDSPCQYGGTCVQFPGSGYLCLCPLGKHGHYCEHNLEVALPSFSGSVNGLSSFVAYTVPIPLEYSLELSFKILPQTMSQISLLAFLGQSGYHNEKSDHLAVSFIQGYVMLTWNLGGGPRRIFTQKPIDFRLDAPRVPYEIKIGRIGRQAWLSVDGKFNISGRSPGSMTRMDVIPILYLGGHEIGNFKTLPHDLPLHSGFQGCIYDVNLKAGQVSVPLQETRGIRGRGVGQCGTRECHRHACQHDGACLQHGATFTCICQEGWYGPLCGQSSNPCDSVNNKCSQESTCVPLVNGYECDCPIGLTGKNCEEELKSLSDVSLTGRRSYLTVRWPYLGNERTEKIGSKRSQLMQYRNFTKKIVPKPVAYKSAPGQHFVMKLLSEVEKQRSFTTPPETATPIDNHHRVQFFFIEFQIRPLSERGLLLYFGTLNHNQDRQIGFVSLSLQGGVVEFRISGPNNHVTVVRSVRMLAIGEWHKIKMAQRGRWLTLWVEGSASSALAPSAEVLIEPESLLYIGGLKDLSKLPHNAISGFPIPFRGCVRGLVVSGTRIVLNETNILESRNIRDCDGTACGGDSCESGGHCWLDEKLQPHCICPEYSKGDRCEYSETCKLVQCKNNGRCLRSGRCSCPNGYGGFYCEIAMSKQTTPHFKGNSYLVLPPPRIPTKDKRKGPSMYIRPREALHVSLNFSTINTDGILLWTARDKSKFLGIGLEHGNIKLSSSLLGKSNFTIIAPSTSFLSDGAWHNVLVATERGRIELIVDDQRVFTEKTIVNTSVDTSPLFENSFYLGGFPNAESVSQRTFNIFHNTFKGCIQDIKFGNEPSSVITDFSSYNGENIGSCELHQDDSMAVYYP